MIFFDSRFFDSSSKIYDEKYKEGEKKGREGVRGKQWKQRIGNSNKFLSDRERELEAVLRLNYAKTSIPGHAGNSSVKLGGVVYLPLFVRCKPHRDTTANCIIITPVEREC